MNFDSHLDGVVAIAAALVNATTPGQAQGREHAVPTGDDLRDAVADALDAGRPHRTALTVADAAGLAAAGTRLRSVFVAVDGGDHDTAADTVNALLAETGAQPHLERHDGEPWHLHYHGRESSPATNWTASCATALATVIGSEYTDRLGVCSAPACDRVYVDTSRNGTRQFCSASCQSRVKAAAYRARQAG
ncbi:MAG: CGNR zinc finger domain-containing protein [Nocardioidaceae bacterium]